MFNNYKLNQKSCGLVTFSLMMSILFPQSHDATETVTEYIDLGSIVVTAEKRPERIHDVPQNIDILSKTDLDNSGISTIKDASYLIPNLYISELAARRTSFPVIRGIGAGQGDPSVTTYLDGIPQLTPNTTNIELLDIDRIEFLRGPQGALYGRNTLGGVINIISAKPTNVAQTNGDLTIGDNGLQHYRLTLKGPILEDRMLYSLAGSFMRRDGFSRNLVTDSDVDDKESYFGRAQLLLLADDAWEISLAVLGERDRDGGFVLSDVDQLRKKPFDVSHSFDGYTDRDVVAPSLSINYSGATVDFAAVTGYGYWSASELTDVDFTAADIVHRQTDEDQHQAFQELRLSSAEHNDLMFSDSITARWTLGLSMYYSDLNHHSRTNMGAFTIEDADYNLEDYGFALFGFGTVTFLDRLDLHIGLRYDFEHKDTELMLMSLDSAFMPITAVDKFDDEFSEILPRLGITYEWSESSTTYGSIAKGFRAGGYNRNVVPGGVFTFDEEKSWSFEIGQKTLWFDRRLAIDLATFYIDWDDMQLDVPIPGSTRFFLDNVGQASSTGFEVEFRSFLTDTWECFGGFGYVRAEFEDYMDPSTGDDVDHKKLPNVPNLTWNLGIQNRFNLSDTLAAYFRIEVVGVGELYYDNANSSGQNDYGLVNIRTGIEGNNWYLNGWVRNALDREYIPLAFPETRFSSSGFVGRSGAPRTAGINLGFKF